MNVNSSMSKAERSEVGKNRFEREVATIWSRVLGVENVGPQDNFILLGGESLLAVEAAAAIRDELGCEISIRSIFVGTVADVAAEVRRGSRDRSS